MSMSESRDDETLLVFRCVGVHPHPNTNFKSSGVLRLSSMLLRAAGQGAPRAEKRVLKVSQSEPFKPFGHPLTSNYTHVYVSELFEDNADILCPALVASIRCPAGLDCKVRLGVYYASSLTGDREVLLASTSFSRTELAKACTSQGVLISEMITEYVPGAKAYIEIMQPLPRYGIFQPQALQAHGAGMGEQEGSEQQGSAQQLQVHAQPPGALFDIVSRAGPANPVVQRYVFYGEQDPLSPRINAEESAWEPRHAAVVPALFLDAFCASLVRSINCWRLRYELERMRQGRFASVEEAHAHGWHSVNVCVIGARVCKSRAQTDRLLRKTMGARYDPSKRSSRVVSMNLGGRAHSESSSGGGDAEPLCNVCVPVADDDLAEAMARVDGRVVGSSSAGNGGNGGSGVRRAQHDDSAPCTFVEVRLHDQQQAFQQPLGRTNTEYFTMQPLYGSNLNAQHSGKRGAARLDAGAASASVNLLHAETQFSFYSYNTTDRDAIARGHQHLRHMEELVRRQQQLELRELLDRQISALDANISRVATLQRDQPPPAHSQQAQERRARATSAGESSAESVPFFDEAAPPPLPDPDAVHSVRGTRAHMFTFVPRTDATTLEFAVCLEDPHGPGSKRMGTCCLQLSRDLKQDCWLKMIPSPDTLQSLDYDLFEEVEVRVKVTVLSPGNGPGPAQAASVPHSPPIQAPSAMPEVLQSMRAESGATSLGDSVAGRGLGGGQSGLAAQHAQKPTGSGDARAPDQADQSGAGQMSSACSDYRATLAGCYDWMWSLGFNGHDPMMLGPKRAVSVRSSVPAPAPGAYNSAASTAGSRPPSTDSDGAFQNQFDSKRRSIFNFINTHGLDGLSMDVDEEGSDGEEAHAHGGDNAGDSAGDNTGDSVVETGLGFQSQQDPAEGASTASAEQSRKIEGVAADADADDSASAVAADADGVGAAAAAAAAADAPSSLQPPDASGEEGGAASHGAAKAAGGEGVAAKLDVVSAAQQSGTGADSSDEAAVAVDEVAVAAPAAPPSFPTPPTPPVQSEQAAASQGDSIRAGCRPRPRVDYPLPLEWIRQHTQELEALALEFGSLVPGTRELVAEDRGFRASTLKKQAEWQALPTNLHYQLLAVRPHSCKQGKGQPTEVLHSVSSGCCTPHMLGHKDGGLYHLESRLVAEKDALDVAKHAFADAAAAAGSNCIPTGPEDSFGAVGKLAAAGERAMRYEASCVKIGRRRAYAISQALSIAVNALLLKLGLCVEGQVNAEAAEGWLRHGLLVVFEGLLSVVSHERSMLEDTISAVDAVRSFRVRILPQSAAPPSSLPASSPGLKMSMEGRELRLFVPAAALARLPSAYRLAAEQGGAVVPFFPVLFTQGIDMQQTYAATFASNVQLQQEINLKGLRDVNAYCFRASPILAGTTPSEDRQERQDREDSQKYNIVHPLVGSLQNSLLFASPTSKNVDLLVEAERLTLMLGGCRVTFCKSGKDRTGMATTLEQSRQLGERYGCGMGAARTIRDANLMRVYGCRLLVAEKNVGRKVYSINKLQAQFFPDLLRPPTSVCEDLLKKDNS